MADWPRLWGIGQRRRRRPSALLSIPDRFDGQGEVVGAVVDQLPHPVGEHGAFPHLGGIIAVVERVLADRSGLFLDSMVA